jgi:DNA-binding NarL/FixJ family response regulator
VAGADGRSEQAARFLGAAGRLRESIGAPTHPVDRADHERTMTAAQLVIGKEAFAAAWAAGQAMPLDEIIKEADSAPVSSTTAGLLKRRPASQLTTREREVAVLIARGLRNREIAEQLVVTERTVTAHVEQILNKLGFHSRAQVATWVTEQRLPARDG